MNNSLFNNKIQNGIMDNILHVWKFPNESTNIRLRNIKIDRNDSFVPLPHSNRPSPKDS